MKREQIEQTLLRAARAELGPAQSDRERNRLALWSKLESLPPLGGGVPGAGQSSRMSAASMGNSVGSPDGLAGSAGLLGRWGGWMALSLGLLASGAVGGGIGFGLGYERGRAAAEVAPAAAGAAARPAEVAALPVVAAPEEDLASPDPREIDALASASDGRARLEPVPVAADENAPGRGVKPAAKRRAAASGRASSLAEELAMLQRARRALADENGRLALGIVQELDERWPQGLLLEEREATRILSLCQLQRTTEARARAGVFLERHASSVYAPRVKQSCISDLTPAAADQ